METWRPPPWTAEQLDADRALSLRALNDAAMALDKAAAAYEAAATDADAQVRELLLRSGNLLELTGSCLDRRATLLGIARFLTGPPQSHDNLERLIGKTIGSSRVTDDVAERAMEIIAAAVDRYRFPWVAARRDPTPTELHAATVATATLVATERSRTLHRNDARRLELLAGQALEAAGLVYHPARARSTPLPWSLPPGSYCDEAKVAGTNCDRPAHVRAHEIAFLIECKGSSTEINGTKRLKSVKEAAATWRRSFGDQVLTVAVVSGAFKLEDLRATQSDGVFIVWEHDLSPLTDLVARLTRA